MALSLEIYFDTRNLRKRPTIILMSLVDWETGPYIIPNIATYYPNLNNLAIADSYSDTAIAYDYPPDLLPFPYFIQVGQYSHFTNVYYVIMPSSLQFDGQTAGQVLGVVRFPLNLYIAGTYKVTIQLMDATHL